MGIIKMPMNATNERSDPMSPNAVSSLVGDLVAMAKAAEELPQVEAALEVANNQIRLLHKDVENRLDDILKLQERIDVLSYSLKTAEASRDDAELRFLELEERFGKLAAAIEVAHSHVAVANAVATPEVAGEAHPFEDKGGGLVPPPGQSVTHPMIQTEPASSGVGMNEVASQSMTTEGQSAKDPTPTNAPEAATTSFAAPPNVEVTQSQADPTALAKSSDNGGAAVSASASVSGNASQPSTIDTEHASEKQAYPDPSADAAPKPYAGKNFSDVVGPGDPYISHRAWEAGGGTYAGWCS